MRHYRRTECVAGQWTALRWWRLLLLLLPLLASTCAAKPSFTFSNYTVVPGQPFTLTWTGANGAVDINVANGTEEAVSVVWWIAHNDTSTSFVWTPPDTLPSGSYMFEITDSSGSAYSGLFQYVSKAATPTTPNSPSLTQSPSNSTTSTTGASSPVATGSETPTEPELNPGAKAGIAIGATAAAILGMVICSVLFYRRGRAAGRREAAAAGALGGGGGVAARGGLEGGRGVVTTGAEDKEMFHELETSANLPEMQGSGGGGGGGVGAGLGGSSRAGGGSARPIASPR